MGAIMIKCPTTGQSIATGIETDPNSFRQIPDVLSRSRCPICGLEHDWSKREAWIGESVEGIAVPTNGAGCIGA
jgi:hypothetical protein